MLKIKQKNCRFKVDTANRVVVCWVAGESIANMANNFLLEQNIDISNFNSVAGSNARIQELISMPARISGVAKCAPNDNWNPQLGKLIAYNKMKKKLMTIFFKRLNAAVDHISRTVEQMSNAADAIGMRFETELTNREAEIEKLLNQN